MPLLHLCCRLQAQQKPSSRLLLELDIIAYLHGRPLTGRRLRRSACSMYGQPGQNQGYPPGQPQNQGYNPQSYPGGQPRPNQGYPAPGGNPSGGQPTFSYGGGKQTGRLLGQLSVIFAGYDGVPALASLGLQRLICCRPTLMHFCYQAASLYDLLLSV